MSDPVGATDYVLSNSSVCRYYRRHTRKLVPHAVDFLSTWPDQMIYERTEALTKHLRAHVKEDRLGNPILVFILLNIVIPIVVRLIIEWWLNR